MTVVLLLTEAKDRRLRAIYRYSVEPSNHPVPDGCELYRWIFSDPPSLLHPQSDYCVALDGEGAIVGLRYNPPPPDMDALRSEAENLMDANAARMMENLRPAAAARMDAERVRQAELALASADEHADAYPLLGGTGSLHERARAVLTAAQATADRLVAIDLARREAKAKIRAASDIHTLQSVTLEIPE